ncbi:hypothetical protein QJS04_geneDACA008808 [Acorus gramineus]|uniref:Uncharacterized protein n=1 Tax=Acorus gramineus TaxID=55184 RepID=A0AAV9AB75_ACOGR|nr:hypothetical protein QJS04_geneDACA008808 [Acorus gramineus]
MDVKEDEKVIVPVKELGREDEEDGESDDCVVLDFNPFIEFSQKLTINEKVVDDADADADDDDELSVISCRGPMAHKEWPHWRHLCDNFPFGEKPHEDCCDKCYCYVCDKTAPCEEWKKHCDANGEPEWRQLRVARRQPLSSTSDTDESP